jgi:uncharacterized protein (AIM24 family)
MGEMAIHIPAEARGRTSGVGAEGFLLAKLVAPGMVFLPCLILLLLVGLEEKVFVVVPRVALRVEMVLVLAVLLVVPWV